MRENIERFGRLVEQQQALTKSGPFGRLVVFFADFDPPLVQNTVRDFEPALPTTVEGVVFTGGGFLIVYLLLHGMRFVIRRPRPSISPHARRHYRAPPSPP